MTRKRKTTFYLTEPVREWIIERAAAEGVSRSCFVFTILKALMYKEGYCEADLYYCFT